ncbi:hypothetical protein DRP07_00625 [Archaeoglobales archaeon]|nr:MAG: hypothetical protein DRP07_00625 [Archaeoglobales archaeon]
MTKSKMYENVKTWNPFVGCKHDCVYCKPSFQRQAKRRKKWCELCYNFEPHFHPERLERVPNAKTIFACAYGDIVFARSHEIEQIFKVVGKHKNKTFLFQSKDPECFGLYLIEGLVPENVILGTTIETNYSEEYEEISQAPPPYERYEFMYELRVLYNARTFVTIEPILEFNLNVMVDWIKDIQPEFIYIGYDNHNCKLPEPPLEKTLKLIEELEKFTEVRLKTIRKAWWENDMANLSNLWK